MVVASYIAFSVQLYLVCATVQRTYTNEWAVKVSGGSNSADEIAYKHGFENRGLVAGLSDVYLFVLSDHSHRSTSPFTDKSTRIIAEDGVEFAEQQHLRVHVKRGYSPPTDPNWNKQWPWLNTGYNTNSGNIAGRDINVQPAWIQGITGCNVNVAIVDDGVECTHPDLLSNYITSLGWNYLGGTSNPFPGDTKGKRDSHGTSCAGEVGMNKSNTYCGAGVAYNAGITGIRLIADSGASDTQEANALSHLSNYIQIYSNSWGPDDDGKTVAGPRTVLQMAFQNNVATGRGGKGSIYVWSAGNGGDNYDSCAADGYVNSIYIIPIGAASSTGEPAYYDEPCSGKMAVAFVDNPNQSLLVSTTSAYAMCTDTFSGTSSATPLVSGALALVLEANPNLTWRDIQYLIVYTANPNILSPVGWQTNGAGRPFHLHFGFGAIDTEAMLTRAKRWVTVPAQMTSSVTVATTSTVNALSSRGYTFTYTDAINYLEHVVIKTTLTISGVSGDTSSTSNRGKIYIQLQSPNGTLSNILPLRMKDNVVLDSATGAAYFNWPFKSLHFWGENPAGTWNITVTYNGASGTVMVSNTTAVLYGTSQTPPAVASIPRTCDQACARGCSSTGPSNCDVCAPEYYRNVTTLACAQNCTSGTAANGYCYYPSDPDPVCARSQPPSSARGTCGVSYAVPLMVNGFIVMMVATFVMFL